MVEAGSKFFWGDAKFKQVWGLMGEKEMKTVVQGRVFTLALLVCFGLLSGCVSTKTPTIAHVHVGHALTGWTKTPDRQGLFVIAEKEAAIARQHARYAVEAADNLKLIKVHTVHILHALDPGLAAKGPGLGYGFQPAINNAVTHIRYAADSNDVSANIKAFAPGFEKMGDAIERRINIIIGLANAILDASSIAEAAALSNEVLKLAEASVTGADENGDGVVGIGEGGLNQMRQQIEAAVGRENPPYATVDTFYLFNLIRLSSGDWAFKDVETAGYKDVGGGGGGSY